MSYWAGVRSVIAILLSGDIGRLPLPSLPWLWSSSEAERLGDCVEYEQCTQGKRRRGFSVFLGCFRLVCPFFYWSTLLSTLALSSTDLPNNIFVSWFSSFWPRLSKQKKDWILFMSCDDVIIFCIFYLFYCFEFWFLCVGCPGTQESACLCFLSAGIKGLVLFNDFPFASQLVWPSWSECLHILTYLVLCFQIVNLWLH